MIITLTMDDFLEADAYDEYMRIANSDIRSIHDRNSVRFCPSFDARRLYGRAVKMCEIQGQIDRGEL
jgi:hypothetical protein